MTSEDAPGWDAIVSALERTYGTAVPMHFGTVVKWSLGGPDPLDGLSAYARTEPTPHWHIVSFGMSELHEKVSDLPERSGWGFELTFRPARAADERQPPAWALNLMQNLGRYVFESGNSFAAGDHIDLGGPIALDQPRTPIVAAGFAADPELPAIDTPHGSLAFLQIVGLTADEYDAARGVAHRGRPWPARGPASVAGDRPGP